MGMPARARVVAMPGPMVPSPIIAAFVIPPPVIPDTNPACAVTRWSPLPGCLLEGRPSDELLAPGPQSRKAWQVHRKIQAAVNDRPEADIRQRDCRTGEPGLPIHA